MNIGIPDRFEMLVCIAPDRQRRLGPLLVRAGRAVQYRPLNETTGGTNRYWYQRDGLGNVVALTDVSGTVVDQYAYDVWGKPTLVQETVPQQLRYQGYWYDNELGWYWLTTRSYDPALERFLQPDPSETDGLFSYVYVGDDPVDMKDPSGFAATPVSCDGYCQTLIALDNVWPQGMSAQQFASYGGNPATSTHMGVNSGGDYWNEYTPQQYLDLVASQLGESTGGINAGGDQEAASHDPYADHFVDVVPGPWGYATLMVKQVGEGAVEFTMDLNPNAGLAVVTVNWSIVWASTSGRHGDLQNSGYLDVPFFGRMHLPDVTFWKSWFKTTSPVYVGRGILDAVFGFTATLDPTGTFPIPETVGGSRSSPRLPRVYGYIS